jgi:hypothetical protein
VPPSQGAHAGCRRGNAAVLLSIKLEYSPVRQMKLLAVERHFSFMTAFALLAIAMLSACASPVGSLQPTIPDFSARTIFVSVDTWHAVIAFPPDTPHASSLTPHANEEWGYAERAWYLENQRGFSGIVRALFWPTEGVVEVGHYDRMWADRTPQPPAELFRFRLSDEGFRRLQQHLRATLFSEEPVATFGQSAFYPAKHSYHLFHTCHQYAAHALREADLPISPFWAFNRTSFAWQLRRAARIAEQPTKEPFGQSR